MFALLIELAVVVNDSSVVVPPGRVDYFDKDMEE